MEFEQVFMFYLPRICEHCLNPSCVASCPSGAMYKREEDGIVLVDQDRCRGWRMCVSGCPYKKVYFNHRTGKAEKCTFCFPRIEAGQPTICSETCVGRLRYLGLILYDADKVLDAAATPDEQDLYEAQLSVFLDPDDPQVQAAAGRAGHPRRTGCRRRAARRSTQLAVRHRVALPLHPEYRTLPMVWYIPPLSPVSDIVHADGYDDADPDQVFATIDALRIPIEYLANLFTAGKTETVRPVLRKLAVVRAIQRAGQLGLVLDEKLTATVDASLDDLDDLYRLLAIAKYDDRYVIPTAHAEDAGRPDGPARAAVLQPGHRGRARDGRRRARTASRHRRRRRPGRTTSGPTTAAPASTCSAGTAGGTRRTCSPNGAGMSETAAYKLASVLLQYPTAALFDGLDELDAFAATTSPKPAREAFAQFLAWLRATPPTEVAQHYVETFDLRRRCALYLTYYRYGDTRKRGMAMIAFKTAYRDAGFVPSEDELPDYLPMVLDFADLCPRGRAAAARAPGRPGAAAPRPGQGRDPVRGVVAAVCAQLPKLGRRELGQVLHAWESGPPREEVGLEPFAPPEYLAGYRGRGPMTTPAPARAVLVGGPALPGARRLRRRARLAVALRPVRLDQPLHPAAGTPAAQVGRPAVPLRHLRRHRRARHRRPDPRAVDPGDRHPRERLPLVLRRRGHARRGAGHRRRGRAGGPAAARAAGPGDHHPDRLPHADPAADHHHHRHRPHHLRQPVRPRLRLPHHRRALVPRPVQRLARRIAAVLGPHT